MSTDTGQLLKETEDLMRKSIAHLEAELAKVRAGKATPQMLDGLVVDYYGNPTPINQVGNISVVDARTLTIQPWERNMLQPIERSILQANIGITPQNDGNIIRIFLPPMTEERRRELVKKSNHEGEHARVSVRNLRRDAIERVKKMQKDGLSEDAAKDTEVDIQELTDRFIALVEKHLEAKEKEIMHV
ncbi:MAG: ribosome recycling factor [Chitinophagaceae bacterium]|jgi:ribosome recycling factor|nr:ribosome recycling factor [Chitinophagaceae bacterium]